MALYSWFLHKHRQVKSCSGPANVGGQQTQPWNQAMWAALERSHGDAIDGKFSICPALDQPFKLQPLGTPGSARPRKKGATQSSDKKGEGAAPAKSGRPLQLRPLARRNSAKVEGPLAISVKSANGIFSSCQTAPSVEEKAKWTRLLVPMAHVECLGLPNPLDRVYLFLDVADRPKKWELDLVRKSENPSEAFVQLLIGNDLLRRELEDSYQEAGAVVSREKWTSSLCLAAMTVLFSQKCKSLRLAALERPEQDLRMLVLWSNLTALSYSDSSLTDATPLNSLQNLAILELSDMGEGLTDLSNCSLKRLQQLTIRNCAGLSSGASLPCCAGLSDLCIKQCARMKTIDGILAMPTQQLIISECPVLESICGLECQNFAWPPQAVLHENTMLSEGIVQAAHAAGTQWLDLQGCPRVEARELLVAARTLKEKVGRAGLMMVHSTRNLKANRFASGMSCMSMSGLSVVSDRTNLDDDSGVQGIVGFQKLTTEEQTELMQLSKEAEAEHWKMKERMEREGRGTLDTYTRFGDQGFEFPKGPTTNSSLNSLMQSLKPGSVGDSDLACEVEPHDLSPTGADVPCDMAVLQSTSMSITEGVEALRAIGFDRHDSNTLLEYMDVDRKGYVTYQDMAALFEDGPPATTEDMMEFCAWVTKRFASINKAFEAFCACTPRDTLRPSELKKSLQNYGWQKCNAGAVFNCLDSDRKGWIGIEDCSHLQFFVSLHRVRVSEEFCRHVMESFKSLRKAFKHIDDNDSGVMSLDELQGFMTETKLSRTLFAADIFQLLDRQKKGELTLKEFMALEPLSIGALLGDLRKLHNRVSMKYGTFSAAFGDFVVKEGSGVGLTFDEFLRCFNGILHFDKLSDLDPALLFYILNQSVSGSLSQREFRCLDWFGIEATQKVAARSRETLMHACRGDAARAYTRMLSHSSNPPACLLRPAVPVSPRSEGSGIGSLRTPGNSCAPSLRGSKEPSPFASPRSVRMGGSKDKTPRSLQSSKEPTPLNSPKRKDPKAFATCPPGGGEPSPKGSPRRGPKDASMFGSTMAMPIVSED